MGHDVSYAIRKTMRTINKSKTVHIKIFYRGIKLQRVTTM